MTLYAEKDKGILQGQPGKTGDRVIRIPRRHAGLVETKVVLNDRRNRITIDVVDAENSELTFAGVSSISDDQMIIDASGLENGSVAIYSGKKEPLVRKGIQGVPT